MAEANFIVVNQLADIIKLDSNGNVEWTFTNHTSNVLDLAVDQNGFIYSASQDETVRKIDSNGNQIWSFTGHTSRVEGVAVDDNGFVYSASGDGTVRKIDSNGNQVWSFTGHTAGLRDVVVDKNGFVYSGGFDDTVRKIDPSGNQVWSFTGHSDWVFGLAVDQNGNVYSGSWDDTVKKIDSSGNQVWSFTSHTNAIFEVAVDQNDFVYSASDDATVRKIDSSGNQVWSYTGFSGRVSSVGVDLNGNVYAGGADYVRKINSSGGLIWEEFISNAGAALATSQSLPLQLPSSPIKLGETDIFDIYKGSTLVDRAYKGGTLVYGQAPPIEYNLTFYQNQRWRFFETDPYIEPNATGSGRTDKISLLDNQMILTNSQYLTMILFWDNNTYLGAYIPGTVDESNFYVISNDDWPSNGIINAPTNATDFALVSILTTFPSEYQYQQIAYSNFTSVEIAYPSST